MNLSLLKEKTAKGIALSRADALSLVCMPLEPLCQAANELRALLCTSHIELCSIINGKSGKCSEDCKYCAQSSFYQGNAEVYSLLRPDQILESAISDFSHGVQRFSTVTCGKNLTPSELAHMCTVNQTITKHCSISLCGSHGLLSYDDLLALKQSGITRYHCNLETSEKFFPQICTTHAYSEKVQTIKNAQKAGLQVCSGGIIGLGESVGDRIDMAIALRDLKVDSVPLNVLTPIPQTPFEDYPPLSLEEVCRTIAIFRFILGATTIRLACGRMLMKDQGRAAILSGANALISGDMLTTRGHNAEKDIAMLKDLGFSPGPSRNGIFVTGTGTDVGKTYISSILTATLRKQNINAAYFKPVLSGIAASDYGQADDKTDCQTDCQFVYDFANSEGVPIPPCPNFGGPGASASPSHANSAATYLFHVAASPHLASALEHTTISIKKITAHYERIHHDSDFIVAEGCGGIVCPLCLEKQHTLMQTDVIKALGLNAILVADAGLGSINSTLLAVDHARSQNILLKAIILNNYHKENFIHADNKQVIEQLTGLPVYTCSPNARSIDISTGELQALLAYQPRL